MTAKAQTLSSRAGHGAGADLISAVATRSNEELMARLDEVFRVKAAAEGEAVVILGELDRRAAFEDDGATSTESGVAERFGVSGPTARALTHVGQKASKLPHLVGALQDGDISLDKVRAVADVANPHTDRALCEQARACSVRQLVDVARTTAQQMRSGPGSGAGSEGPSEHDRRYLHCNDALRTLSLQLPAVSYAETKATLEARAKAVPSDGETPWDQRLCDAFLGLIRSATQGSGRVTGSPHLVVAHVPLSDLVEDSGEGTELVGELEGHGLVDAQTIKRLACDATVVVALDDALGHTMYEGRAKRFPTDPQRREVTRRDRRCRFPGCSASTFTNVHHIVAWKPGGKTDLDNLALLCEFHHHKIHSTGWSMTGNANVELRIVGPSGRVMVSRPDPRWSMVTGRRRPG